MFKPSQEGAFQAAGIAGAKALRWEGTWLLGRLSRSGSCSSGAWVLRTVGSPEGLSTCSDRASFAPCL